MKCFTIVHYYTIYTDNTAPFYRVIYNRTFFGRYDRYTIPGFILLLFGVTVIGLSVADVTYTTLHYGSNCNQTGAPAGLKPCSGQHFYTYIASGIWGGLLVRFKDFNRILLKMVPFFDRKTCATIPL